MSKKMHSRVVSVSKFTKTKMELDGSNTIPHEDSKWVVIKWFHPSDYENQEYLNDASEIFTDEILKGLSYKHFIRIEDCKEVLKNGRFNGKYKYITARLERKDTI